MGDILEKGEKTPSPLPISPSLMLENAMLRSACGFSGSHALLTTALWVCIFWKAGELAIFVSKCYWDCELPCFLWKSCLELREETI